VWLFSQSGWGADPAYSFLGMMPVAPIVACSVITLVGVSLLTAAPSEETLRKFFQSADKEALTGAGVAVAAD
jgi:hypothetical protein